MNKLRIPQEIQLFGDVIKVVVDPDLSFDHDAKGMARYREGTIRINAKEEKRPEHHLEIVYFHELVHWILYKMDYEELNDNEQFVTIFSGLLHQSFATAKYTPLDSSGGQIECQP
jgi:predicted SprT family Zn-dependent metalloprotease